MSRWLFVASSEPGEAHDSTPRRGAWSLEAVAETLMALSPAVALARGGVWVEISRSVRLFGSELALARRAGELAARLGGGVQVVLADQPETARILASAPTMEDDRQGDGRPRPAPSAPSAGREAPVIITPGGDAAALAPLPLQALEPSAGAAAYLARLGLRRVGELARLSPAALRQRRMKRQRQQRAADITHDIGNIGGAINAALQQLDQRAEQQAQQQQSSPLMKKRQSRYNPEP